MTPQYSCVLIAIAALCSQAVAADPLQEPHLSIIPRSEAEIARVAALTAHATEFGAAQTFEENSAGAATVRVAPDSTAFSLPSGSLSFEDELEFKVGSGLFRTLWSPAPGSRLTSDGLGPLYNARSCERCHIRDGRGHPPESSEDTAISMVLRVSIPGGDPVAEIADYIATSPDPVYGMQLQDHSLPGHLAEYRLQIDYEEIAIPLVGGEIARLRRPIYSLSDLGYGPLHPEAMLGPRVAPQMIGLGLLEAIPAADILALADPDDQDGDGISGRANIVWSTEFDRPMLGRFGFKAGIPTLRAQTAGAFAEDIGISTPLLAKPWGDCTPAQTACRAAPHGDGNGDVRDIEMNSLGLDLVTFYSRNLGVPARRNVNDPMVLRGKELFYGTGCVSCHQPSFVTHRLANQPDQSFQLIWPYTDMLLHDMGEGLADNRPDSRASGREWRTPPLWGIGLTRQVSGHSYFLHDGRARNLLEAVLWHGGEAKAQRDAVIDMTPADRRALLRFLESL